MSAQTFLAPNAVHSMPSKTRRDLFRSLAVAGGAAGAYALALRPRAPAAPNAGIDSIKVISMRPHLYHGWPTVARRKNGELLTVCSGGREAHVCPFGWVEMMRSKDNGATWAWPQVLMDTAIDDRDAGVCETAQGSLLVTTFTSLAYIEYLKEAKPGAGNRFIDWTAERIATWKGANQRTSAAEREAMLGTWMLRSADGGVTWSAPYRVPVNSPHGPIPLSDGRVIYAGKRLWHEKRRIGVADSRDDGQTWQWLAEIPTREGDDFADYHELHIAEASNGRLIAQIRNHNKANERETLQSESSDGGRTWSIPHAIGVWGLPSHLLRLKDERLLMSYGYRRAPFGNQARISEDNGATWSQPMVISDDGDAGDLGYPSTVQLNDGSLVTIWYERLKGTQHAVLRQANWRIKA
ncbi:MAG TPA: sialidase family protein [Bryobacterales bacterium]|nr:sialidase family protein [Bryobacterales bacterium]